MNHHHHHTSDLFPPEDLEYLLHTVGQEDPCGEDVREGPGKVHQEQTTTAGGPDEPKSHTWYQWENDREQTPLPFRHYLVLDAQALELPFAAWAAQQAQAATTHPLEPETEEMDDARGPGAPGNGETPLPRRHHLPSRLVFVAVGCLVALVIGALSGVLLPLFTASAQVTLLPDARLVSAQTRVSITTSGTANAAGQQIPGRLLATPITLAQMRIIPTSGIGEQAAQAGHGSVTFYNASTAAQVVPAETLLVSGNGVQVVTEQAIMVPGAVYPTFGQVSVMAHALTSGPSGNLAAGAIYGPCCRTNLSAVNGPFVGGQQARSFPMVTAHDLEEAIISLKVTIAQSVQAAFANQVHEGETLLVPVPCTASTKADHRVGEEARAVSVTVSETCSGIVYETAAMQAVIGAALTKKAEKELGAAYTLVGEIGMSIVENSKSTQDALPSGVIPVEVSGKGTWAYQFSLEQLHQMARMIAGKNRGEATTLLLHTRGVRQVGMTVSGVRLDALVQSQEHNKRYPNIRAHLTEPSPLHFREVAVSRDARGNYYCSFVYEETEQHDHSEGIAAFDLGIKTLATGYSDQGRVYHIGGFKGYRYYNKQLDKIRSMRDRCKKKSRRYIKLSKVYKRVSEKKRNKQRDCLHKASHLIAARLVERTVVIGDLSQRQMVTKKQEHETPQQKLKRAIHNRLVYNDWGLYGFVRMLIYKCLLYGKELHIIDERDTSKTCNRCKHKQEMPLWKRTYHCPNCGLVMGRDENSACNIYERFLAWLRPHTSAI